MGLDTFEYVRKGRSNVAWMDGAARDGALVFASRVRALASAFARARAGRVACVLRTLIRTFDSCF